MNKKIKVLIISLALIIIGLLIYILFFKEYNNKLNGTETLKEHGNLVFSITKGNKDCVPVEISFYDDNTYELFTDYATCKKGVACTMELRYTKSIKGTYNYDLDKIINSSTNANDKSYSIDNYPKYEIFLGEQYAEIYDSLEYTVEKDDTNKYLDELLKQIKVDLNLCANKDYVK